jgi:hypothetical protein
MIKSKIASGTGDLAANAFTQAGFEQNLCRAMQFGRDTFPHYARAGLDQTRATACGNTTSISVPEWPPVLILNLARLASTRALVSDRLTREFSD